MFSLSSIYTVIYLVLGFNAKLNIPSPNHLRKKKENTYLFKNRNDMELTDQD